MNTLVERFWSALRKQEPVVPPAAIGLITPEDDDDPDTLVIPSSSPPSWPAESITGKHVLIQYRSSAAAVSERQIICHRLEVKAGSAYIFARCLLRKQSRSFRIDRIQQAVDIITGEVFDPGSTFFHRYAPNSVSASALHFGLAPRQYADFNAALNVLAFIARCDGSFDISEREAIENFATSWWMRSEIQQTLDLDEVCRHIYRLAPDAETMWASLQRCMQSDTIAHMLQRHICAVMDADGMHHEREVWWCSQIDEFMRE
ncbi:UNVERIFIED_ORG: uncharacterized membrane protein YebE (DUF533 family) [Sphingomonas sp. R1F5B]